MDLIFEPTWIGDQWIFEYDTEDRESIGADTIANWLLDDVADWQASNALEAFKNAKYQQFQGDFGQGSSHAIYVFNEEVFILCMFADLIVSLCLDELILMLKTYIEVQKTLQKQRKRRVPEAFIVSYCLEGTCALEKLIKSYEDFYCHKFQF